MEQLTHFKKLANPDYIGAYSLYGADGALIDMDVTITSIAKQNVIGADGKTSMCTVAQLAGQKPLILNATNQKMLAKLFKTPFIEQWIGQPFTLYVTTIRIAGEPTECLRIRPALPVKKLPELTPTHAKWDAAKKAIQDKKTTIEEIRKSFSLTAENEAKLNDTTI